MGTFVDQNGKSIPWSFRFSTDMCMYIKTCPTLLHGTYFCFFPAKMSKKKKLFLKLFSWKAREGYKFGTF